MAARLGSGERFRKLSGTLAARGASNPDALAAWIGRKKFGPAKMAKLSAHSHANGQHTHLDMADDESGDRHMHEHSHDGGSAEHNHPGFDQGPDSAADTTVPVKPAELRTPAPDTGYVRSGAATTVRGGGSGPGLANQARGIELAARPPITSPSDILVSRGTDGTAIVRHRRGGTEIGRIRHAQDGWRASIDGRDTDPRTHQRAALMDLLGGYTRTTTTPMHKAEAPLQPAPQQTELMEKYGIPAIRALATPAPDEPDDDDSGGNGSLAGLTPKGVGIYKKLRAKGWDPAKCLSFAKRAQSFGGSK